ncbi:molybdate ABC transporter substrate-binding protein [Hymenobacter sp. UV11]|uniref:molybdate ABC transporter substrate-binding protein n=1 Tax=Hymenobacter sp. UV11 TaxID=1849735 RepID=UPI00105F8BB5|nr:molybdate ABC transporter substrate-binding protein [Hymenobacter sp. UV11]TDN37308.1 molybdate ABC transporter substrate-binding protein [Hymenobacter sp. UV11]TFZ68496.1 molybdate ABC transporter substrate-binding protein [Hymenobacter sp. UV11]
MLRFLSACLLLSSWLSAAAAPTPPAAPGVTIAAAADLKYVLDSLVTIFNRQHPQARVTAVYGSSGKFYEQLSHGAPFDIFFSADSDYPRRLQQAGLTTGAPTPYALGRLVLWSKKLNPSAKGINTLLAPQVQHVAVANPAHAPYGRLAEEVLRHYRLYDQVKPKLVLGENIGQAAQYAATGAADAGLLAYALALSPELRRAGRFYLIPVAAHSPLQQSFVVLKRASGNATAAAFATFMASPAAKQALKKYGFGL